MTEEHGIPQQPVDRQQGSPPEDDEPTLETPGLAKDDEPTLETEAQSAAADHPQEGVVTGDMPDNTMEVVTPKVTGWASRLEHMAAVKRDRRRQSLTRFWWAAAPVFVLLVIAVVLLAMYGGQGGGGPVLSTTTTAARQPAAGSGLLLITDDEELVWVVVLQPWRDGGVVLGVPGITLLESDGAFKTLSQAYAGGQAASVQVALAEALDIALGPVAVAELSKLRTAAKAAGVQGLPEETPMPGQGEAEPFADAVRTLVGEYDPTASEGVWTEVDLQGETAAFQEVLSVDQASMAKDVWTVASLDGTMVSGDGFAYYEPDVAQARSLLAVDVGATIVLAEIKDGAGLEGAAHRAGELIESGGLALAPMSYAEGYPGVETTQILASPGSLEEARQVRALLGVGEVKADDTLAADRIVVILGKDFGGGSG